MAKDPAFLFYPNDWIGGTLGMTFEQKGAYMEVLMAQFNRGHMTEHMIRHMIGQLWDTIKDKFSQDSDGLWFNARLDSEKEKRKTFVQSRYNNISGKNQYPKKTGHMSNHMENVNGNRNKKGGVGENIKLQKGERFDENFSYVYFPDGSKQELGEQQKELAMKGLTKPYMIIQSSIY